MFSIGMQFVARFTGTFESAQSVDAIVFTTVIDQHALVEF